MEGKGVYRRFGDIDSIRKWLCEDNGNHGATKTVTKTRPSIKLKPGQKIKIPKPSSNALTFNDLQRARAVLQQNNTIQLQSGDSEEIDVITPDNHSSQWNSYAITPQELLNVSTEIRAIGSMPAQQQLKRRLTVKQPKSKETSKRKRSKSPNENKKEPRCCCNVCGKKYQQKSSLLRHQRQVHAAIQPNNKNNNNETPITEL